MSQQQVILQKGIYPRGHVTQPEVLVAAIAATRIPYAAEHQVVAFNAKAWTNGVRWCNVTHAMPYGVPMLLPPPPYQLIPADLDLEVVEDIIFPGAAVFNVPLIVHTNGHMSIRSAVQPMIYVEPLPTFARSRQPARQIEADVIATRQRMHEITANQGAPVLERVEAQKRQGFFTAEQLRAFAVRGYAAIHNAFTG